MSMAYVVGSRTAMAWNTPGSSVTGKATPDATAHGLADDDRLVSGGREPGGLERARVHLVAEPHRHGPERDRDQPTDDAAEEHEAGEILRADGRLEAGHVPRDREGRAEQERWYDALVERREDLRHHRDAVAREHDEVLLADRPGGAQLAHQ